ncbi:MAG: DUF58 domain-containing protein [Deltaproteobacteria bacterium]|nr:MAG: DUF58 domain-containing protein [Deltaproteobacteria bacterium]
MSAPSTSLTPQGWAWLALSLGIAIIAWSTGNNLTYLILGAVLATWVLDGLWGWVNLRSLEARRELPPELFARSTERGAFLIKNTRRWIPSLGLTVHEEAHPFPTRAPPLAAGVTARIAARWRFEGRGPVELTSILIRTRFPFGLWERCRKISAPLEIVVFPAPRGHPSPPTIDPEGGDGAAVDRPGPTGDLTDLRNYRQGDAPRHIHWPTSARVGRPIVVQRSEPHPTRVIVVVRDLSGQAWETEISRACGEIVDAARRGHQIGLRLAERYFPPSQGASYRRSLLDHLARLPRRAP